MNQHVIRYSREKRQRNRAADTKPQAQLDMPLGAHRIPGAKQITKVVNGGNQPGAGQRELPVADHQRHLRGKRKAANPHRHHQHNKAAERYSLRHRLSKC